MLRFTEYTSINEGRYPNWVKIVVGAMVLRIKNLEGKIKSEKDVQQQNKLISQQNSLISYIGGLGIAVSSSDKVLMNRMKSRLGGGGRKR